MTFSWTRADDRVTSMCVVCLAHVSSRQEPVIRAWQRTHDPVACRKGREAEQQVTRRASHETMKTAPTEVVEHLSRGLTHSSDLSREGLA